MKRLYLSNIDLQRFAEGDNTQAENVETVTTEEQGQDDNQEEVKTYTQEELDELLKGYVSKDDVNGIVQKRVEREKAKAEEDRKEAERLSKLSAEERAKEEAKAKDEKIAELEAEIARNNLEKDTVDRLNQEGIPIEFKSFLMLKDAESTNEAIKTFKPIYEARIQEEVEKRFKGKTPKSASSPQAASGFDFLNEKYKK